MIEEREEGKRGRESRQREKGEKGEGGREETDPDRAVERAADEVVLVELEARDRPGVPDERAVRLTGTHCEQKRGEREEQSASSSSRIAAARRARTTR